MIIIDMILYGIYGFSFFSFLFLFFFFSFFIFSPKQLCSQAEEEKKKEEAKVCRRSRGLPGCQPRSGWLPPPGAPYQPGGGGPQRKAAGKKKKLHKGREGGKELELTLNLLSHFLPWQWNDILYTIMIYIIISIFIDIYFYKILIYY